MAHYYIPVLAEQLAARKGNRAPEVI